MSQLELKFGKVAVLMGGASAEREVSLMSGQGVLQALRDQGVDAHAFDPSQRDLAELKREGFSRCFIGLHGRFGEDGTVQGALELLGIPYTGSGVMASSIAIDKVMTKRIWRAEGLPTPAWQQVDSEAATRAAFAAQQLMYERVQHGANVYSSLIPDPAGGEVLAEGSIDSYIQVAGSAGEVVAGLEQVIERLSGWSHVHLVLRVLFPGEAIEVQVERLRMIGNSVLPQLRRL